MSSKATGSSSPSIGDVIAQLKFVSSAAPAVYLDEALLKEAFTINLGAIASFTHDAHRQVAAGVKTVVSLGGSKSSDDQIQYDVSDPLTQALVLRNALIAQHRVEVPALTTKAGTFVEAAGSAYFPELNQPTPPPANLEALARSVGAECQRRRETARAFGDKAPDFISMLLAGDEALSAAVVDCKHIRADRAADSLKERQVCFGLMQADIDEIPMFTLLYMRPDV